MKKFTLEEIEKAMKDMGLDENYFDMGLRTPKQVEQLVHTIGNFAVRGMGNKIYKLPGGGYCGQGGWDLFLKELKKQASKL